MTASTLKAYTCKDLADMAKKQGVRGWHSMRKDQLVRALVRAAKSNTRAAKEKAKSPARRRSGSKPAAKTGRPPKSPRVVKRVEEAKSRLAIRKDLALKNGDQNGHAARDRLVLMVRDPYWLHVHWELAPRSVARARAAMKQHWHTARPVLRLVEISSHTATNTSSRVVRDIEIHGGVNNWYIDVTEPPRSYRVEIGYLASDGEFFTLLRSNSVTTPSPCCGDALDGHWSDGTESFERIYAMSGGADPHGETTELQKLLEERLGRPVGSPMVTRFGDGAQGLLRGGSEFQLEVDAELIVHGVSKRDAYVTVRGEPVSLSTDGTFTVRFNLPDKRQVIPVVANSVDGVEQRTILLAVERNTKVMEPRVRDCATE